MLHVVDARLSARGVRARRLVLVCSAGDGGSGGGAGDAGVRASGSICAGTGAGTGFHAGGVSGVLAC